MSSKVGDDFQNQTKYCRGQQWTSLDWLKKPEVYKNYPSKRRIKLPRKFPKESAAFADLLRNRKSIRNFSPQSLSLANLAFLLWASTGVQRKAHDYEFRTAPSAGALYPIETYILVNKVEGLEKGLYHYDIAAHALEELRLGNFGQSVACAALDQEMCMNAPVTFIWTAIFERSKWKYKQRAYRYIYLDAGHMAQNLALAATSIGLGSCQIGAIFDDEVNEILGVDGFNESTIYLSVVGFPDNQSRR